MKKLKTLSKIKFDIFLVLLSLISLGIIISSIRYGLRTFQIPIWDEQHYMRMSTEFYRMLKHPTIETPSLMLQVVPFRQPGYALSILPFLFLFGLSKSYLLGIVTNAIFYALTIFGIYFLAKNYLSNLSSFLAAFIFAFYGWPLYHIHTTYSETAASAMSLLSVLFLVKSDYFRKRNYSFLFGVIFGIALLMKWVAFVCLLGPILYVVYQIINKRIYSKEVFKNILLALLGIFIFAFYPYYQSFNQYFQNLYSHRLGGPVWEVVQGEQRNPLSLYSLTYYLNTFSQLGIFYFLLFIFGFVLALRKSSKTKLILLAAFFIWLFLTYAILKDERYIIPIYPYIAILSASVFEYFKNKRVKYVLIFLTVILSIGTFLGTVWGKGPMKASLYSVPMKPSFGQINKIYLTSFSKPPNIYKLSGREIIDFIHEDSLKNNIKDPKVFSLFSYRPLDEPLMVYNLYTQEKPIQINNYLGTIIADPELEASGILKVVFRDSDYLVTKTGDRVDSYFPKNNYLTLKAFIKLFDKEINISDYFEEKTKIWVFQDSSTVTIFKNKKQITQEELDNLKIKLVDILKNQK